MYKISIIISLFFTVIICVSAYSQPIPREELLGMAEITKDAWDVREEAILRRETYEAFDRMQKAARKKGIRLKIVSSYRSFDRQKQIWEYKWNSQWRAHMSDTERALNILEYSSMPGTSRHHWGTDIDLNSVEPEFFEKRRGRRIYRWLCKNAADYGFFQPYTEGRDKGYAYEPWHWSYAPLSDVFMQEFIDTLTDEDIAGFEGSHVAVELGVIEGWVDINDVASEDLESTQPTEQAEQYCAEQSLIP